MIKKTFGLAACGVMAALAAAGCGSDSSGSTAASPKATTPAWAKTLGPGVTVTDSRTAKAGDGSPAGVFLSMIKAAQAGNSSQFCALYEPSFQPECESGTRSMSTADFKSGVPTYKDHVPSYTAFDGDRALLGFTGTVCAPGSTSSCDINTNPAALFDSGESFSTLWRTPWTAAPSNGSNSIQGAYALARLIRVNGAWYFYATSM